MTRDPHLHTGLTQTRKHLNEEENYLEDTPSRYML